MIGLLQLGYCNLW